MDTDELLKLLRDCLEPINDAIAYYQALEYEDGTDQGQIDLARGRVQTFWAIKTRILKATQEASPSKET